MQAKRNFTLPESFEVAGPLLHRVQPPPASLSATNKLVICNLDKRRPISYTLLTVKKVVIYTDGACSGNPGPGGWGALLISGTHRKEISGGERQTTNNRMELAAAIEALKILKEPAVVDLFTDSVYVKRGMTEWLPTWKKNNWKRKSGKRLLPVKNEELWHELDRLVGRHRVTFHWVEGHAGHAENERCDTLARQAIPNQGKQKSHG